MIGVKLTDKEAMALAITEAQKGSGFVSPNPPVGCVILDKNREFLSSGFYARYGAIHAEMMAIDKVKDKTLLEGAHLFVTLEPCSHFGQNPPCVQSLIKYSWKKIVYGIEDPNPKVSKKGIKKLRDYGLLVQKTGFFQLELKRLYEAFTWNMKKKRTFFALKTASSLDGVAALSHGESQWITEPSSRDLNQNLRLSFDAILVGLGTFLQDDPRLNVRSKKGVKNKVILLDPEGQSLDMIPQSQMAKVRPLKDIYVVSSKRKNKLKVSYIPIKKSKNSIDLNKLSFELYRRKITSVLVEGGAKTFVEFLRQQASFRIYQFINPSFIGGVQGAYWTENLKTKALKNRINLFSLELLQTKPDFFMTGLLSYKKT